MPIPPAACELCGGNDHALFAERPARADVLHSCFVRCRHCGFIFASPKHDAFTVADFYSENAHASGTSLRVLTAAQWEALVDSRTKHLLRARAEGSARGLRFLDIGFGDGSSLAAAERLGYGVCGLELDPRLTAQAKQRVPSADLRTGDLLTAEFESESFDVIYTWHTVEHVLDVRSWLTEVHRILRPGGQLILGTESAEAIQGRMWCRAFRLAGRTPWPPTSTDHTYWFTLPALTALLHTVGFGAVEGEVYENPPSDAVRTLTHASGRGLAAQGLYVLSSVLCQLKPEWGGKMIIVATRS